MIKIEASILSADLTRLGEQVGEAEQAGADGIQVDVMDGIFVPNITFGTNVVRALRPLVKGVMDVHLMIGEPGHHVEAFVEAGADCLIVHQEACPHLHRVLRSIQGLRVQAGVSVNPGTPLNVLEEVLDVVDVVQIMTVNPGWGGQSFLHGQLDKIHRLSSMLEERGRDVPIAVDGGIDPRTAPLVVEAGARILVAGSSIYNDAASPAQNVTALRESIAKLARMNRR